MGSCEGCRHQDGSAKHLCLNCGPAYTHYEWKELPTNGEGKVCCTCSQRSECVTREDGGPCVEWEPKVQAEPQADGDDGGMSMEQPAPAPAPAPDLEVDSKIAHGSKKSEPFRQALTEVWRVSMFGEQKHGANNWMAAQAEGMHYYEDALWRHWMARRMGEVRADDSGVYHLAHLVWNALMLLEMELRGVTNPEWGTRSTE